MMQKLLELYPDHEFSHFRAICISLIRHPNHHASHKLAELLSIPGMSGFAIKSYKDSLLANRSVCHENSVRNSQLKELYLAKALHRCSPENQDAIRILEEYKEGLIGCYSVFAQSI